MSLKDLADILASFAAVTTLVVGVWQYSRSIAQQRLRLLLNLYDEFERSDGVRAVRDAVESNRPGALKQVSASHRVDFAAFIEKTALMVNSKLLKDRVAFSMFSFYAIAAQGDKAFWVGLNEEEDKSIYWEPFNEFVERMKEFKRRAPKYSPSDYTV
jgi:hypothetical protein